MPSKKIDFQPDAASLDFQSEPMAGPVPVSTLNSAQQELRRQRVKTTTEALREQANPSLFQKATSGVVSPASMSRFFTGQMPEQLQSLGQPVEGESPLRAAFRAGTTGTLGDVSQTASEFTSPVSLSTMALGEIGKIPGAAGKIARGTQTAAGIGFAGQGAAQALQESPEDETQAEAFRRRSAGLGQVAAGLAGGRAAAMGPEGLMPESASRMMGRSVPTAQGVLAKELGLGYEPMKALLSEDIYQPTPTGKLKAVRAIQNQVGQQIESLVKDPANNIHQIQPVVPVAQELNRLIHEAPTPGTADTLANLREHWLQKLEAAADDQGNISPQKVWELSHEANKGIRWRGEGEVEAANNEGLKAIYTTLRSGLQAAIPEIAEPSARYTNLSSAERVLDHASRLERAGSGGIVSNLKAGGRTIAAQALDFGREAPDEIGQQLSASKARLQRIKAASELELHRQYMSTARGLPEPTTKLGPADLGGPQNTGKPGTAAPGTRALRLGLLLPEPTIKLGPSSLMPGNTGTPQLPVKVKMGQWSPANPPEPFVPRPSVDQPLPLPPGMEAEIQAREPGITESQIRKLIGKYKK